MIVGTSKVYVRTRRVKDGWKARMEVKNPSNGLSIVARQAGLEACHRAIVWRLAIAGLWSGRRAIIEQCSGIIALVERWRAIFGWRLMIERYTIKLYRARSNRTRYNNRALEQLTFP